MSDWNNLNNNVIQKKLCCLCGTCVGICPTNSINIVKEKFVFQSDRCISCGFCVDSCPGKNFDYNKYNKIIFNKKIDEISPLVGSYKKIYKGYSTNNVIREMGSSGGVASAVAYFFLDRKIVDGVVGIVAEQLDPTSFKPVILRTKKEVFLAFGSKYTLVPTNIIIKEIINTNEKFLFIGLPCQIQGLQKAMERNIKLRERIFMTVSIFCGFNMERKATDFLIKKSKFPDVESIRYRATKKDETGFLLTSKNGKEFFIDKHDYTFLNVFFSPERCWKCYDLTGEFADLSLGDAWELEKGSRIIVRSEKAQKFISDMKSINVISIENSSEQEINETQSKLITYKKKEITQRAKKLKNFPDYGVLFKPLSFIESTKANLFLKCLQFGKSEFARTILYILPIKFMGNISRTFIKSGKGKSSDYNEIIRYGFWGVVTVLVSYISYALLTIIGVDYKLSNLISLILTKVEAYLTNKYFVFKSKNDNLKEILLELVRYIWTRGLVGLIDFLGLILFVEFFGINKMLGKVIMLFITTVLNYFFGKKHVFIKK